MKIYEEELDVKNKMFNHRRTEKFIIKEKIKIQEIEN